MISLLCYLLFFEIWFLFLHYFSIVFDEVQVSSRGYCYSPSSTFAETLICLMHGLVNKYTGVHNSISERKRINVSLNNIRVLLKRSFFAQNGNIMIQNMHYTGDFCVTRQQNLNLAFLINLKTSYHSPLGNVQIYDGFLSNFRPLPLYDGILTISDNPSGLHPTWRFQSTPSPTYTVNRAK